MIENEFWLRGSSGSFAELLLLAFHLYRLVLHALLWLAVLLSRWAAVATRDGVTLAVLQKCVVNLHNHTLTDCSEYQLHHADSSGSGGVVVRARQQNFPPSC